MGKNSKHYRWQARWTLDRADGLAKHDSGIAVRMIGAEPEIVDQMNAITELAAKHGGRNAEAMLRRLAREARAVWSVENARDARL
jgi:hypothetical protein